MTDETAPLGINPPVSSTPAPTLPTANTEGNRQATVANPGQEKLGGIQTGPVSAGKPVNAKVAVANAQRAAVEQAQSLEAGPGQVLYIKEGYPVFNTATAKGKRISFDGGRYLVDKADPFFADIVESLQCHVDRGVLITEDGGEVE